MFVFYRQIPTFSNNASAEPEVQIQSWLEQTNKPQQQQKQQHNRKWLESVGCSVFHYLVIQLWREKKKGKSSLGKLQNVLRF